jgi:hypothetical protein
MGAVTSSAFAAPALRRPASGRAVVNAALCPDWARNGIRANQSYLSGTSRTSERTINDEVFDKNASKAMRTEYETRFDTDEARSNAGLTETYEEKGRFQVMKDFAKRAFNTMSNIRLKEEGDKITKYAQTRSDLPREPIAIAVLSASLYTGRSMAFHVFDTRVETKIMVKDHVAEVTAPIGTLGTRATLAYNHAGEVCAGDNGCALISQPVTNNVSVMLNSAEKGTARAVYSISF